MNHVLFASNAYVTNIAVTANKTNADSVLTWVLVSGSECFSCHHLQVLQNRSQTKCWKKCQRSDYENRSDQKHTKKRRRDREGTERRRNVFLLRQVSRNRQHGDDHQEAPDQRVQPDGRVVPKRVGTQASECRTVVTRSFGE